LSGGTLFSEPNVLVGGLLNSVGFAIFAVGAESPLQAADSLFFFDFHRTNLRIPPDLSPVSIRLALLFLLLTRGACECRKDVGEVRIP
jgi:hypothetical protein